MEKTGEQKEHMKVVGLFIWVHRDEDSREEKNGTRLEQPEWSRVDPIGLGHHFAEIGSSDGTDAVTIISLIYIV